MLACNNCKKSMRNGYELIGYDSKNNPVMGRFAYCDVCRIKYEIPKITKRLSFLGVSAFVMSFFTALCLPSFIMSIVDLCGTDGNFYNKSYAACALVICMMKFCTMCILMI